MTLDKRTNSSEIVDIHFTWERVVEKANASRDKLLANAPKAFPRREVGRTRTTDTLVEPELLPSTVKTPTIPAPLMPISDEGPDRNSLEIIKMIRDKETTGKDITTDERRMVVNHMRMSGQTQDSIAELLEVSRRTIVNDYKVLRQQAALEISTVETSEIAGEVYEVARTCIRRALAEGSFKTVSVVMRDMVEVLQSMGMVYRAPKTSMQGLLHGSLAGGSRQGYHKYIETIGDDKSKVVEVLDHMFNAILEDRV